MASCLCCEPPLLTWTKRSSYPCWPGGTEKAWESKQCFPVIVSSSSIKPFLASRPDSVLSLQCKRFWDSSWQRVNVAVPEDRVCAGKTRRPSANFVELVVKIGGWIRRRL